MRSALDARAGFVYFMERVDGTRRTFKIGWTARSVDARRREIEGKIGARLAVVHTVEAPAAPFLDADSGQADRPFRPMPITRSGKAITPGP
jgi:hypothetical protein